MFETLEPRLLLDAGPDAIEQYAIALINRARADATAEAARFEIDLNEGLGAGTLEAGPRAPVAPDPHLTAAAREHGQWMLDEDTFTHEGADGSTPHQRMSDAGFRFVTPQRHAENLALLAEPSAPPLDAATVDRLFESLFVDQSSPGRSHRVTLLSEAYRQVGVGQALGDYLGYAAQAQVQDFARSGSDLFLTGSAYDDRLFGDDFYSPGEGLGGIAISAEPHRIIVGATELSAAEGTSASFTVRLSHAPIDPDADVSVSINPRAFSDSDLVLSDRTLTFTSTDWNIDQTVTVTASDDPDALNGTAVYTIAATGYTNAEMTATELDDDPPQITIAATDTAADHFGPDPALFEVTRAGSTEQALTVRYTVGGDAVEGQDFLALAGSVVIEAGSASQTITIEPVANPAATADRTVELTLAEDAAYELGDTTAASATIHLQALVVSVQELDVHEGGSATFTIRLARPPVAENDPGSGEDPPPEPEPASVIVNVGRASGDSHLRAHQSTYLFTEDNWDVEQTVLIVAAEDPDEISSPARFIVVALGMATQTVIVTEIENDVALMIDPPSATVPENGQTPLSVSLTARPEQAVTVNLSFAPGSDADFAFAPESITIEPDDWASPIPVTVTAGKDTDAADGAGTIRFSADGLETRVVTISEEDDDVDDTTTTWEAGGYSLVLRPGTYTVVAEGFESTPQIVTVVDKNVLLDFRDDTEANLEVESPTYAAGDYGWNNAFQVDGTIRNTGSEATSGASFTIEVRLSTDEVWGNADDLVVAASVQSGALGAGAARGFQATGAIPDTAEPGLYYVAVTVDADSTVAEQDDLDNTWWSANNDVSVSQPQPMIELTSPSAHVSVRQGDALLIAWTDSDGDHDAQVELFRDTDFSDQPWTSGDGFLLGTFAEDLDGDGDQFSWDTGATEIGTYAIWARITDGAGNTDHAVAAGVVTITSVVPQIDLTAPARATTLIAGETLDITWTDIDSDDNAQITIAYDADLDVAPWLNQNHVVLNDTPIPEDDPADTLRWDTTGVAPGDYRIWARITDGVHETFDLAEGVVTIETIQPHITIRNLQQDLTVEAGDLVLVAWTDSDADDNADIRLAYDPDDEPEPWLDDDHVVITAAPLPEDPDGDADQYAWDTTGLAAGTYTIWAWITDGTDNTYSRAAGRVTVRTRSPAPIGLDLLDASDTGELAADDRTSLNNVSDQSVLQLQVDGTIAGALVELLDGITVIGTATATGDVTLVTTDAVTVLADGAHELTARQTADGELTSELSPPLTVTIDTAPPVVTGVSVFGSTWTSNPDLPQLPQPIPVGSGNQLAPLTWPDIDQVVIEFDEPLIASADDLSVTGDATGAHTITTVTFDGANAMRWSFAPPLAADTFTVVLADTARDLVQFALDGEWTNPVDATDPSGSTFPSGDGAAGGSFEFRFAVAPVIVTGTTLDVDGDGLVNALSDGILIARYLAGLTGDALTADALGADATRTSPDDIVAYLDEARSTMLDPDGNGRSDALSDGRLILRHMAGFDGDALVNDALAADAVRTDPNEIRTFLEGFLPTAPPASSSARSSWQPPEDTDEDHLQRWLNAQ